MADPSGYTDVPLTGLDNYTALSDFEEPYSMPTGTHYDPSNTSQQVTPTVTLVNHQVGGNIPQNYNYGQYMPIPQPNTHQVYRTAHHNGMVGYAPMQQDHTNWTLPPPNQVLSSSQRNPPPLGQTLISTAELTELREKYSSTLEKVNTTINRLEKVEADMAVMKQRNSEVGKAPKGQKGGGSGADAPRASTEAESLVQAKFQSALGISTPAGRGKKFAIPPPLEPDFTSPRMNATGVRLWNPDWRQSATASINQEFIDHVVELLLSEEEHKDEDKHLLSTLLSGKCKKMVTTYFNNTARRWKSENDEAKAEKAKASEARTRRQLRKKRAATKMRQGAKVLTKKLGKTACVGIDELVHTEWMDSQHSTSGEADDEEWENRRVEMGGGANQKGIEVRQNEWVSPWLRRLWGYMLTVALEADDQAKARPASNQELMRFRGLSVNSNTTAPPMATNLKPHRHCIRDSWANTHPNYVFPGTNMTHTVMQIDVATAGLDSRYAAYYECDADDEGEKA